MELTDRIVDSTTGIKMKSGAIFEIHIINQQNGEKSIILENTEKRNERLVLKHNEIMDFIEFLNEFLASNKGG